MKNIFIFLVLLWSNAQLSGNETACPYGCGGHQDPNIHKAGQLLIDNLEKIDFLQDVVICDDVVCEGGSSQELADGTLFYDAACHLNFIEEEDDEIEVFYEFSRERSWELSHYLHSEFVGTDLSNYPEVNTFVNTVLEDIDLIFNTSLKDHEHPFNHYENSMNIMIRAQTLINEIYKDIFNRCINTHRYPGSFYYRGLLNFQSGYFVNAFSDVSEYLKSSKGQEPENLYLFKGTIESAMGMYGSAIESLNKAIKKNPEHKEIYIERAVAYYELGKFDLCLNDYLISGIRPYPIQSTSLEAISFSIGITSGIIKGGSQAGVEFIPSLLSSCYGIGHGLWAFVQDPVQISIEFVKSAEACVDFIRNNSSQEVLKQLVLELKELFDQWDLLEDCGRGECIGYLIGKYGVDIFAGTEILKGVKLYRDPKNANNLLTFEAMAISKRNCTFIQLEAAKRAHARQEILHHSNLKIDWNKQGKHIQGHKNFGAKKSILEHADIQKLSNDFCGKGVRAGNKRPGTAGYVEIVDFGGFIGYAIDYNTAAKTATTWGKIHYALDGIHIVPTKARW